MHAQRSSTLVTAMLLVLGCGVFKQKQAASGQSPEPADEPDSHPLAVASEESLPPCDAGHEGVLYYVKSTADFRICTSGTWDVISLVGPKGEAGPQGDDGPAGPDTFSKAFELYRTYRASVFRTTLTCHIASRAGMCADTTSYPDDAEFFATAFLCGTLQVCTNRHVVDCGDCYAMTAFSMQASEPGTDTVNSDHTEANPFFSTTTSEPITTHPESLDLARIALTTAPPQSAPLPLTGAPAASRVKMLDVTLSLGFPLGFQDLYVDVGHVNTSYIGECEREGGDSGYDCPADEYVFSTTNDTDHGSSGSPIIDVESGEVIGITAAGTDGENVNFTWAIDAHLLKDFP